MPGPTDPLASDREFYAALLAGDAATLDALLADDFLLIEVMSGSEVPRDMLLEVVAAGQLRFDTIEPAEARLRRYGPTAVVTGRTVMTGHFGANFFSMRSRYTHVFVEQSGRWRLASAQGTAIAPPA
jgi:ketosteroid isomerase-like protein